MDGACRHSGCQCRCCCLAIGDGKGRQASEEVNTGCVYVLQVKETSVPKFRSYAMLRLLITIIAWSFLQIHTYAELEHIHDGVCIIIYRRHFFRCGSAPLLGLLGPVVSYFDEHMRCRCRYRYSCLW